MAYTFNGIGTTFYGQRDFHEDNSYITTEWVVFIYLPIIPLRSLRVKHQGQSEGERRIPIGFGSSHNCTYSVLQKSFPNWKQVLCVYGYVALMISWMPLIVYSYTALSQKVGDTFAIISIIPSFMIPASIPAVLRYFAVKRLRTFLTNRNN